MLSQEVIVEKGYEWNTLLLVCSTFVQMSCCFPCWGGGHARGGEHSDYILNYGRPWQVSSQTFVARTPNNLSFAAVFQIFQIITIQLHRLIIVFSLSFFYVLFVFLSPHEKHSWKWCADNKVKKKVCTSLLGVIPAYRYAQVNCSGQDKLHLQVYKYTNSCFTQ